MKNVLMFVLAGVLAVSAARGADLEFLKKLVEIPSASADIKQVNVAMRAMKEYLEKRGLFCTIETEANGRETLFAATKPGKVQDYILAAHLDVVPASWEGQYAVVNDNGRLTGRGVGDDKGGSLAVAQTLCALVGKDVKAGTYSFDVMTDQGYESYAVYDSIDDVMADRGFDSHNYGIEKDEKVTLSDGQYIQLEWCRLKK